jgi:hypothetical protein
LHWWAHINIHGVLQRYFSVFSHEFKNADNLNKRQVRELPLKIQKAYLVQKHSIWINLSRIRFIVE